MNPASAPRMPDILFTVGALDYFNTPVPAQRDDTRRMGFVVGRQIVGLYIVEILLKRALVEEGAQPKHHHGLLELFRDLPNPKRHAAESKYQEILAHRIEDGWDFQKSVESFLEYLGEQPHHRYSLLLGPAPHGAHVHNIPHRCAVPSD